MNLRSRLQEQRTRLARDLSACDAHLELPDSTTWSAATLLDFNGFIGLMPRWFGPRDRAAGQ